MAILLGESDPWHHRPLYMVALEHPKTAGCAGAVVTRGIAGLGAQSQIKTVNIPTFSVDLPVVITAIEPSRFPGIRGPRKACGSILLRGAVRRLRPPLRKRLWSYACDRTQALLES